MAGFSCIYITPAVKYRRSNIKKEPLQYRKILQRFFL